MPLIAAVASLSLEQRLADFAVVELASQPGITLGERHGPRQAFVYETSQRRADRLLDRLITDIDGVIHVDVVSAFYDELLMEVP